MNKITKIAIYKSSSGKIKLKVNLNKNTVWLSLNQLASLFDTDKSGISRHIKNIFDSKELSQKATVAKIATVQDESGRKVRRNIILYNLDLIISVGYRVNSIRATQFRIWATRTLKQFLVKGYVLNNKRLREQQKNLKILSDSVALIKSKIHSICILMLYNYQTNYN